MDRKQLDQVAIKLWPRLENSGRYWASECLVGTVMWDVSGDPSVWVLYQLYNEREGFKTCLSSTTPKWPGPPGFGHPGIYHATALRFMKMVENKEQWQHDLCTHFERKVNGIETMKHNTVPTTSTNPLPDEPPVECIDRRTEEFICSGPFESNKERTYTVYNNGILETNRTTHTSSVFTPYKAQK